MTRIGPVDILDGDGLRAGATIEITDGRIATIDADAPDPQGDWDIARPLVCPGLLDLQVNGGGGMMLGDCQTVDQVLAIVQAHRGLGTTRLLPTLISDTPRATARIVDLTAAAQARAPGILGLHLEGPHLARAGVHDPTHLRDLEDEDVDAYLRAKERLGHLLVTLAPERARPEQITALARAGVVVSLGHSDCDYGAGMEAFDAGARMATHLFNAMSGLHHREPGLAGAALDRAEAIGIIADGHHLHPAVIRLILNARSDAVIAVSDAMAVAGTDLGGFSLAGRTIRRAGGRLEREDGTLAGADLGLLDAIDRMAAATGLPLTDCLVAGFDRPHRLLTGRPDRIATGGPAEFLCLDETGVRLFDQTGWRELP